MKPLGTVGRTWVRLAIKAVAIIAIISICFGVFVGMRRVSDISMNGRLNDGDFVLFNRITKSYNVGDVVFYSHGDREYLSEIIAVEDDLVTVNEDGFLLVNDEIVSSAPVYDFTLGETNPFGSGFRVPTNSYFVLNSNYECMDDSRAFGAISPSDIKGSIIALMLRTRSF